MGAVDVIPIWTHVYPQEVFSLISSMKPEELCDAQVDHSGGLQSVEKD